MKLVIDIPQGDYEWIKHHAMTILEERVANGTPLDKLKERISLEKLGYPSSAGYHRAIMKVLQIIDNENEVSE